MQEIGRNMKFKLNLKDLRSNTHQRGDKLRLCKIEAQHATCKGAVH